MGAQRVISWFGVITGLGIVVGLMAALLWARLVHLPAYVVNDDHIATMSEHGHSQVFAADAWFVVIGLVAGLSLGVVSWSWFKSIGWPVALIATGTGLLSGLVCAAVGQLLGPGPLEGRLAQANATESVPIAFQLHSPAVIAVWGLAAVAPSLLAAALGPELEPGRPTGPRGRATQHAASVEDSDDQRETHA